MRTLNILTLILVIVGGINWGLVGLADFNLVDAIFGAGSAASRTIYMIVGLSSLWQLIPMAQALFHTHDHTELGQYDRARSRF